MKLEDLEAAYNEAAKGADEPYFVVTTAELARKHMLPEEVAAIDAFLAAHPGKNWALDRKTLVVTELPDDDDPDDDEEDEETLPCRNS